MTRERLKTEISKIIDAMPDKVLEDVYQSLKGFAESKKSHPELSEHLEKVLQEDKKLLERLAK